MNIIVIKECNLGKVNDIVKVKDGYAINYLLPKGICKLATQKNIEIVKKLNAKNKKINNIEMKKLNTLKEKIMKSKITFDIGYDKKTKKAKKSITNHDIEAEILKEVPTLKDKKFISDKHIIKTPGEHIISIKFKHNINFEIKVNVQ